MNFAVLLVLLLGFNGKSAHADVADEIVELTEQNVVIIEALDNVSQDDEEVTSPYLKILGRGFENKKTHEILALACDPKSTIDSDCTTLRFVLYKPSTGKTYYVGSVLKVNGPGKDELKKTLKDFKKRYKKNHQSIFQVAGEKMGNFMEKHIKAFVWPVASGAFLYSCSLMSAGVAGMGVGILVLVVPTLATVGIMVGLQAMPDVTMLGQHMSSASFQNTNGWNWSIEAKKISDKKFQEIINFI